MKHIPQNQAATVDMEDHDEDADEELDLLPRVQVFVKLGQDQKAEKGVSSQEREETQEQDGTSQDDGDVLDDAAPVTRPEHQRLLHEVVEHQCVVRPATSLCYL